MTVSARAVAMGGAALAASILLVATASADAQGFSDPLRPRHAQQDAAPCVLDKCADATAPGGASATPAQRPASRQTSQTAPGTFDFYVLSLSWSPGFCDTGGDAKAPRQCAEGANLGFVVHGLWPQYVKGFPSDCDTASRSPSRAALDAVQGVYPDEGLARYEWRKHGTCTGLSPTDYFAQVRQARDAVSIPAALQAPKEPQNLAPLDVARAFVAANPGLRTDMMAVTCRQDELQEVRICFTKDLRGFTPCPEVSRGACRTREISILPVH